jgi:hypothetical protein
VNEGISTAAGYLFTNGLCHFFTLAEHTAAAIANEKVMLHSFQIPGCHHSHSFKYWFLSSEDRNYPARSP